MHPPAPPSPSDLDPDRVLAALANPLRWQFVQLLADGGARSASAVADRFGRDFDGVSKHLRLLRSAGVLASRRGEDRRQELFYLPAEFRARTGELDFGFCLFRVPGAVPSGEREPASVATPPPPPPEPEREYEGDEFDEPPCGFGEMLSQNQPLGFLRR